MRKQSSVVKAIAYENEDLFLDFDEVGYNGNPTNAKTWILRYYFIKFNVMYN